MLDKPPCTRLDTVPMAIDALDARLIELFTDEPQVGVLGASRALGVARGTVQARLDRLRSAAWSRRFAPDVDPAALGYPVTAFCTLEIRQGRGHDPVVAHLVGDPRGARGAHHHRGGRPVVRIVARDNADLQRVIDGVVDEGHVLRASTVIALASQIGYRTLPLVQAASTPG